MNFVSTFSLILLVATLYVGADNCQRWTVCNENRVPSNPVDPITPVKRGKMGPKGLKGEKGNAGRKGADLSVEMNGLEEKITRLEGENSVLNEAITKINQKLSTQRSKIGLLEQEKDEMNNTIFSQTKIVRQLENVLLKQIEQIEIYSNITETLSECHLPDIENIRQPGKIKHNSTVQMSCSSFFPRGVTKRRCMFAKFHPNFHTHPFSCGVFSTTWDEAKKTCKDHGSEIISFGLETIEKRKAACRRIGEQFWTGIKKTNGRWEYPDGTNADNFNFNWYPGSPHLYPGWNFLVVYCDENSSNFGKVHNQPKTSGYHFLCQN